MAIYSMKQMAWSSRGNGDFMINLQFVPLKGNKRKSSCWGFKSGIPYFISGTDFIMNNGIPEKLFVLKKKLDDRLDDYELVYPDEGRIIEGKSR